MEVSIINEEGILIDKTCTCPYCDQEYKEPRLAMPLNMRRELFLCLQCGLMFRLTNRLQFTR
jgi:hypothetical protein